MGSGSGRPISETRSGEGSEADEPDRHVERLPGQTDVVLEAAEAPALDAPSAFEGVEAEEAGGRRDEGPAAVGMGEEGRRTRRGQGSRGMGGPTRRVKGRERERAMSGGRKVPKA